MKPADITQAIIWRCRGLSYKAIGKKLGWSTAAIRCRLNPKAAKATREVTYRWREKNRQRLRNYQNQHYADNTEHYCQKQKRLNPRYAERRRQYQRNYGPEHYQQNKERIREQRKQHRHENINVRLARNLRRRINAVVHGDQKGGSAIRDLGCTIIELKVWLKNKFVDGMSWDNYGINWHIDHVRPLASFDLTDRSEFLRACHFTNLQPLWAEDNLSKGSRIIL